MRFATSITLLLVRFELSEELLNAHSEGTYLYKYDGKRVEPESNGKMEEWKAGKTYALDAFRHQVSLFPVLTDARIVSVMLMSRRVDIKPRALFRLSYPQLLRAAYEEALYTME
jgi:hypothetical protein